MNRFRVVAAVVCMIFLFSAVLIPFANADWTMFRSDPSHSVALAQAIRAYSHAALERHHWSIFHSSLAVVDGVVYIGSGDDNVYALNAANGIQLWNYNTSS